MLTGPQAYGALDEALKDIRREEDAITRRLGRAAERVAKFRETELDLTRQMARLRLTPEAGAAVAGALSAAEAKARELLAAHAREVGKREAALEALETRLATLSAERADALAVLESQREQFAQFELRARETLLADAAHLARLARQEDLDAITARARAKAAVARDDAVEKGQPYEADPLFAYLLERQYGTPAYRASPLFAYLDGKVARLVRFAEARANYLSLKSIPERLARHLERLEAEAETLATELEAEAARALTEAGGGPLLEEITASEARIAALDADALAAEDERDRLTEEHKGLAEGRDSHFESAVQVLSASLAQSDSATLRAQAAKTPTGEDDALVEKLKEARLGLAEVEAEMRNQKGRLATLETRRRELEDIAFEFKTEHFDDPRSRFGEDRLTGDLLNDFLRGAVTASSYWGQWRSAQNWTGGSGPIVPDGAGGHGGFSLPPGGFSPRPPGGWGRPGRRGSVPEGGGGFSRPRGGTRGTRGTGGFKTGGGF